MVLKRRKIYHSARKTRADRERTRLPCNINPARLDSAIAVANFETRKTAASHNRACQRMNEPEEYRQCGIELRSARKLANKLRVLPKEMRRNIGQRMETMRDDLRGDVLKLRDKGNRYRLRIGTFRVLFVLAGDMIQVYAVKDRKEAYE